MLQDTTMVMHGCDRLKRTLQDTAFALLEISFGDGFADALKLARRSDYECAGFRPDFLTGYILVFWTFLTNVLVLNMLVAMMNYTFDAQLKTIRSIWILDVSYRIVRYQQTLPELAARMQRRAIALSIWRVKYWQSLAANVALVFYCMPEVHLYGMWVRSLRFWSRVGQPLKPGEQAIRNAYGNVREFLERNEHRECEVTGSVLRRALLLRSDRDVNKLAGKLGRSEVLVSEADRWRDAIKGVTSGPPLSIQDERTMYEALVFVSLVYHLGVISDSLREARMVVKETPSKDD